MTRRSQHGLGQVHCPSETRFLPFVGCRRVGTFGSGFLASVKPKIDSVSPVLKNALCPTILKRADVRRGVNPRGDPRVVVWLRRGSAAQEVLEDV